MITLSPVKIYFGAVLHVKVRNGKEGAPLLYKIEEEPRSNLSGPEAVAFLTYLANNDLRDLWHKLPAAEDTLRARCDAALKAYQLIK
jgi:hypothetical protein